MSFFIAKLIFAALAVALLAVVGFVGRDLWRKRQAGATEPQTVPWAVEAPKPAKPRLPGLPGLQKKAAEPEPDAPPPVRRRQLTSFVEAEQEAAAEFAEPASIEPIEAPGVPVIESEASLEELPQAAAAEAPDAPPAEPEANAEAEAPDEPDVSAEAETADEPEASVEAEATVETEASAIADAADEPEASVEAEAPDEPAFDAMVLARLEAAFDALQEDKITLDAYAERVRQEEAAVEQHIDALGSDGDPDALEAAFAARGSVRWCLDWAEEQRVHD